MTEAFKEYVKGLYRKTAEEVGYPQQGDIPPGVYLIVPQNGLWSPDADGRGMAWHEIFTMMVSHGLMIVVNGYDNMIVIALPSEAETMIAQKMIRDSLTELGGEYREIIREIDKGGEGDLWTHKGDEGNL